ncbi:uncharacterized protein LOC126810925 [Patella vulgata]|uniref:uncharacterized protein LOC126810925 n=1 Tax=Patella vulgata TaxID=6465 RepID=UPI0024A8CA01|nr:uncharacterized protein LOC126810925 [Patella vulgata]XP_050392274.2 uncharacterized protein LOC126810925 [Patella vulgata]XP_050392275.2 uncharacterized protein LOC126810925 [Patella vulgata]
MNSLFCMQTVAAEAAADAAISNIRKQRELEMEIKEIDKKWLFALKRLINDRLDLLKEFDKIAKVKVNRDYFKNDLRKAKLHNYTDHVRNRMNEQKYIKSHDNFDFHVDPLGKNVITQPMIMESDGKGGREAITSISLDKKKAKHIRGLSELEVKKRRFRIPKVKKKTKKRLLEKGLLPLPKKSHMKRTSIKELEDLQEEETKEHIEHKETSITIKYSPAEDEAAPQSLFAVPEFARTYIPLPVLPLTPEPSFVESERENSFGLQVPRSPSGVRPRLLSPIPPQYFESEMSPYFGFNENSLLELPEDHYQDDNQNGFPHPPRSPVPEVSHQDTLQLPHSQIPKISDVPIVSVQPPTSPCPENNMHQGHKHRPHLEELLLIPPRSPVPDPNEPSSPRPSQSYLPPPPLSPIPPHLVLIKASRETQRQLDKAVKEKESAAEIQLPPIIIGRSKPKSVKFAMPESSTKPRKKDQPVSKPALKPLPPIRDLTVTKPPQAPVAKTPGAANRQKAFFNLSRSMKPTGMQYRKLSAVVEE